MQTASNEYYQNAKVAREDSEALYGMSDFSWNLALLYLNSCDKEFYHRGYVFRYFG